MFRVVSIGAMPGVGVIGEGTVAVRATLAEAIDKLRQVVWALAQGAIVTPEGAEWQHIRFEAEAKAVVAYDHSEAECECDIVHGEVFGCKVADTPMLMQLCIVPIVADDNPSLRLVN